jgi:hypothetical protein
MKQIYNVIICSLEDEEIFGEPKAIGTLQIYNKRNADITQDDLARVKYIRKLIGSSLT